MTRPLTLSRDLQWSEEALAPTLCFVVFFAVAVCMPPHNDTWWQLRAGADMVTSRGLLETEQFSHTAFGRPLFHNHEWLTQLIFYGLFSVGGPVLLALWCAVLAIGAIAAAHGLVRGSTEVRLAWLLLLLVGSTTEWAIRPQVLSLAILAGTLHLVERGKERWLPLLMLLWANLHAVAALGVVVAACSLLEAVIWSRRAVRPAALVLVGCLIAGMATPLGWYYWPRVLEVVTLVRQLQIQEYSSALYPGALPFWATVAGLLWLTGMRFRVLHAEQRGTRVLLLVALALAVAGATGRRNIPSFFLVAVPVVSRLMIAVPQPARIRSTPVRAWMPMLVMLIVIGGATAAVRYAWRDGGVYLGWRPISQQAIAAIRSCNGPLFNGFADGGPLTWFVPERLVFVDSRGVEAYPLTFLMRSGEADLHGRYEQLFQEFGIMCAAVSADSLMASRLDADPSMERLFADVQWRVYAKRTTAPYMRLTSYH